MSPLDYAMLIFTHLIRMDLIFCNLQDLQLLRVCFWIQYLFSVGLVMEL